MTVSTDTEPVPSSIAPRLPSRALSACVPLEGIDSPCGRMLLAPSADWVTSLSLGRLQLTWQQPRATLRLGQGELVLYPLIGAVEVSITLAAGPYGMSLLGTREKLPGLPSTLLRCRATPERTGDVELSVALRAQYTSADVLLFHTTQEADQWPYAGFLLQPACHEHLVGEGTHRRTVREYHVPPGFLLHVGETISPPGGWSSWPAHATAEDLERFTRGETTHEEVMWFACEQPALALLHGRYSTGQTRHETRVLVNGTAHVMPLGSHAIVAHPGSSLFYAWGYVGTALQKQYNQAADDLGTYIK